MYNDLMRDYMKIQKYLPGFDPSTISSSSKVTVLDTYILHCSCLPIFSQASYAIHFTNLHGLCNVS